MSKDAPLLGALPRETVVLVCPEVAREPRRAWTVTADQDRGLSVWCGACRFERAGRVALGDLLAVWPLLALQERPEMGQTYERDALGQFLLRDIVHK